MHQSSRSYGHQRRIAQQEQHTAAEWQCAAAEAAAELLSISVHSSSDSGWLDGLSAAREALTAKQGVAAQQKCSAVSDDLTQAQADAVLSVLSRAVREALATKQRAAAEKERAVAEAAAATVAVEAARLEDERRQRAGAALAEARRRRQIFMGEVNCSMLQLLYQGAV